MQAAAGDGTASGSVETTSRPFPWRKVASARPAAYSPGPPTLKLTSEMDSAGVEVRKPHIGKQSVHQSQS